MIDMFGLEPFFLDVNLRSKTLSEEVRQSACQKVI